MSKHAKYLNVCIPGEEYWGIGIENETYIELEGGIEVAADFLRKNQKRERYSVNYWTQYKPGAVDSVLDAWIAGLPQKEQTPVRLPLLLNGHSFTKCDAHGEHLTTYERCPKPNPNAQRPLLEALAAVQPAIFGKAALDEWWMFDGDTVEFMTRGFYCAKLEDVLEELRRAKQKWMRGLREGLRELDCESLLQRNPRWPTKNYGFAVFATNRRNVSIFNNGTYHINLTLPTHLDKEGHIVDWKGFCRKHQNAARMFQWLSPFLVAKWGSPDVFANLAASRYAFPAGSQRLAASRYVSVGTYNTEEMPTGKQLVEPADNITYKEWWKQMYDAPTCAYNPLDVLGFDINFHKFQNHGLEFRIFDWFPGAHLEEVCRMLIWMLDASLQWKHVPVPQKSTAWNRAVQNAVWNGASALIPAEDTQLFGSVFGVSFQKIHVPILDMYDRIWNEWADQFNATGVCTKKMTRTPLFRPLVPALKLRREAIPAREWTPSTIVRLKSPATLRFKADLKPTRKANKQTQTNGLDVEVACGCFGWLGKGGMRKKPTGSSA